MSYHSIVVLTNPDKVRLKETISLEGQSGGKHDKNVKIDHKQKRLLAKNLLTFRSLAFVNGSASNTTTSKLNLYRFVGKTQLLSQFQLDLAQKKKPFLFFYQTLRKIEWTLLASFLLEVYFT